MRVSLSELNSRLSHLLPVGKEIKAIRSADGLSIECELGDKPDTRHPYRPHKKYPWFCECGYPEHETLVHLPDGKSSPLTQPEQRATHRALRR